MSSEERCGPVEAQIRAARERGDFDQLSGHGKPLPPDELEGLDRTQRFDALLLRSLGELPLEAVLAREVRACRAALSELTTEAPDSKRLRTALQTSVDELSAVLKARRVAARTSRHA